MTNELYHYGVLGMKWGVRRYQNKDGSLTSLGRKLARKVDKKDARRIRRGKEAYSEEEKAYQFSKKAKTDRNKHITNMVGIGTFATASALASLSAVTAGPLAMGTLLSLGKISASASLAVLGIDAINSNFYQK